jgi:hypothetical protein
MSHLAYCVNVKKYTRAVIQATDTDIIMLAMYYLCTIESLQEIWIQRNDQYLPIHTMVEMLSSKYEKEPLELAATLLATYVISGCDTVSYPFRRGKRKAAKVSLELVGSLPNLASFAKESTTVTESVLKESRVFWVTLYGHPAFKSLNTLRQHMFQSSKSDLRSLPATEDAFYFHNLRALYQIILYKQAYLSELALPPVTEFGRMIINGKLVPVLMSKAAKPVIDKAISCKCKISKCLKACSCKRADVPCCATCNCLGEKGTCGRVLSHSDSESSSEDEM